MKDKTQEISRLNTRSRPNQFVKPLSLVNDMSILVRAESTKFNIDDEIKELKVLFDETKSILIPNVTLKKPDKDTNQPKPTVPVPNKPEPITKLEEIKKTVFEKPKSYIIYNEANNTEYQNKEYEASIKEIEYIKKNDYYVSVDQFERAIVALENDIGKGDIIPEEMAISVITKALDDKKKSSAEKIYQYWKARREIQKKSLLRKYWKDQNYTDKYLPQTFRKREREKMKTRKTTTKQNECLQKLIDMKNSTLKYFNPIIKSILDREKIKKTLLLTQSLEFEAKITTNKLEKNKLEYKLKDLLKTYEKPPKNLLVEPEKEKMNYSHLNNGKHIKDIDYHNEHRRDNHHKKDHHKDHKKDTHKVEKDVNKIDKNHDKKNRDNNHTNTNSVNNNNDSTVNNNNKENGVDKGELAAQTKKKKIKNINKLKSSFATLQYEKEQQRKEQEFTDRENKNISSLFKYRIRRNRLNRVVLDRYLQTKNSMNPFDDSFNALMLNEDNIDDMSNNVNYKSFEGVYDHYLGGLYNNSCQFSDNEDEDINENNTEIKNFSNSFKQFLKQKRTNPSTTNTTNLNQSSTNNIKIDTY